MSSNFYDKVCFSVLKTAPLPSSVCLPVPWAARLLVGRPVRPYVHPFDRFQSSHHSPLVAHFFLELFKIGLSTFPYKIDKTLHSSTLAPLSCLLSLPLNGQKPRLFPAHPLN